MFVPGAGAKPPGGNFYPAGATREEVDAWMKTLQGAQHDSRDRILHDDPPHAGRQADGRAVLAGVPGRAGRDGAPAARGGGADQAADAEVVPRKARRRIREQRLLRERRRVDGAGCVHRADDRAVRGVRGRVVQLQGGVRSLHHAHGPRCVDEARRASAASCRTWRTICRSSRSSAAPSSAATRRSASSTSCSPPATATTACRRPRSICRTTSASSRRRAPSACC